MYYQTPDIVAWLNQPPTHAYRVIYADPPWEYARREPPSGGCPYPTMSDDAIYALPVECIAAKDSLLFLWATMPKLDEGIHTVKAWGYEYITVPFVWIKINPDGSPYSGMGSYTNSNVEIVLLGKRGKGVKRKAKDVKQIVQDRRAEHSTKPHEVRRRIDRLVGNVPRIELFARTDAPHWDGVGNGIYQLDYREGSLQRHMLEEYGD